jgi:phytoene desaturase
MPQAIVIGSGIAGLAAAIRLRAKGYSVTVFEASDATGGKLKSFREKGFRFDKGPSLFTMPHFVDELFKIHQKDPGRYFRYHRKKVICNYFWEDGTTFTAWADRDKFIREAALTFNVEKSAVDKYLKRNKQKYDLTAALFIEKSLHKGETWLSGKALKAVGQMHKLDLLKTLHGVNRAKLVDPKLVQLFNRYATYNGSSPFKTSGIMSLIPHLEMDIGTYFPEGGMIEIPSSLTRLAEDVGVEFKMNEKVQKINYKNGRTTGVTSVNGEYQSEVVVSNMDVYFTYRQLLKSLKAPEKILKQEWSSSALIFYWGINKQFSQLDLHNILFSRNYEEEFDFIFNKLEVYHDPTIYINITSKEQPSDAPPGCENWFVMVNGPADHGQDWNRSVNVLRKNIFQKIKRNLGADVESLIRMEKVWQPLGIQEDTLSYKGALYGTSSNSMISAFLRHPNFSRQIKGLYFVGGTAHPGGGIPLCLQSAKIATEMIAEV